MPSYKQRVRKDLDSWIETGLVPADKREAILATLPEPRRLDAAQALAWVGAILLGVALITFIAANWEGLPRLVRFGLVLCLYAAGAAAGAWASWKGRPNLSDGFLTFAALAFAAGVGLSGQIFDLTGDPAMAFRLSAAGAVALALAGRSVGAALVALIFFLSGDIADTPARLSERFSLPWLALAAPAGAALAWHWRSRFLGHGASLAILTAIVLVCMRIEPAAPPLFSFSVLLAALAVFARWAEDRDHLLGGLFYGWASFGALSLFVIAGYANSAWDVDLLHRMVWVAAAGGLIALGRYDHHAPITATGIVGLLAAIAAILADLGLDLMVAAGVFLVSAVLALAVGFALRGRMRS